MNKLIQKSMREVFGETMIDIAKKDPRVVVIVADISHGLFKKFREIFPERYFNIGICEPSIVNLAAGLRKVGLIPFVHTIAPFLIQRSYEQIKLDFGYQKLNINLISVGSSFDYSKLGCSHHCYEDVANLKHFKKSRIFIPGSSKELNKMLMKNYQKNNINYFRLSEYQNIISIHENGSIVEKGNDLTIVTLGHSLDITLKASKKLKKENIDVEIIYFNRINFSNMKNVKISVKKTKKMICVEELSNKGGLLEDCLKELSEVSFKYDHIAINDFIHKYGSYEELSYNSGFSDKNIYKIAKKLISKK